MMSSAVVISLVLLWHSWYYQNTICHLLDSDIKACHHSSYQVKKTTASLDGLAKIYHLTLANANGITPQTGLNIIASQICPGSDKVKKKVTATAVTVKIGCVNPPIHYKSARNS